MIKQVIFESAWESFFANHRLCTFDDFFDYSQGQIINENSKRNVTVFELEDDGLKRTFFMKRFIRPHYKDMVSAFCHFGTLCSQAEVEFRNANILLKNGIETYHPVCYGFQSCLGVEQQSFFITEQINGPCLTDYLAEHWSKLSQSDRRTLVERLALLFQKIHSAGIRLPDSYIWHVYRIINTDAADGFELGMIDLHRMQIRTGSRQRAAKDLGGFLFSLPDGFMDNDLLRKFMETYLDGSRIRNHKAFEKNVNQWRLKISNRRTREVDRIE